MLRKNETGDYQAASSLRRIVRDIASSFVSCGSLHADTSPM
jgi:hypothetical protein